MSPRSDVLLRSEQSDGQLAVIDNRMRAGAAGPPLHVHDFDEAFYILGGELTFQIEDELVARRAGELMFARGGVVHTLANVSEADAHMLIVCTPAGFERHFDEANALPVPPVRHIGPRIPDSGLLPAPPAAPAAQPGPRPPAPFHPTVLLTSAQSGGRISAIAVDATAAFDGPPLHRHDFAEAFYVLDGELTFQLEEQLVTRGAGEFVYAAGGVPHTLANLSGAPARYLLLCAPGGFERYFMRVEAEQTGVQPPAEAFGDVPAVETVGPQIGPR